MGESFFDPLRSPRLFSLQTELLCPRQAVSILRVAGVLSLLPGELFLMDSRELSVFSIQVLTAQFRHKQRITRALLLHWFLGKVFCHFMAPSLDTVALIFSWGNIMKFLWKKYAFAHNCISLCLPPLQFLPGLTFLFLRQVAENSQDRM